MGLPKKALPTKTIEVAGQKLEIRGLSRAEVIRFYVDFSGDLEGAEIYLIAKGANVSDEEAKTWREEVDANTADLLIKEISRLSALSEDGEDPKKDLNAS
jgi:hypothetical protein